MSTAITLGHRGLFLGELTFPFYSLQRVWFKAWSLLNQFHIRQICCIVTSSYIVLLFCRNHFIDVYCHMLRIVALQFTLRRSREIVVRNVRTCLPRNQSGQLYMVNLLALELFFLILAHPIYKIWIIQEPNTLELWNKLHFEEENPENIYHV
jgi:hypothetical protein